MNSFYQVKKLFCAVTLFFALLLSSCAGKKGALKHEELGRNATEEEKKAFALKVFKEGAELLFIDNQAALLKFDEARDLDKTLIAAYFNAGLAEEALGSLDEAAKRYEACLAQNKEEGACLDNLLIAKAKLGEVDQATTLADTYLSEFPEAPFAKVSASKLALFKKDYVLAEKLAREAIERDAENVEALLIMARIFYERKQYSAAKFVLKNALEIAPSHGGLYLLLGHTEMALGQLHDALDSYGLAVKYYPSEEALESYGLLLLKRGRVAEALPLLKRLAELRPLDYRNQLHLGNAYIANKMFNEANTAFLRAQELKPDDKDIAFNLGLLYFDLKPEGMPEIDRLKKAQGYFKSYLEQASLPHARIKEVDEYLKTLAQKIELEEYKAASEKEQEEAPFEPNVPEEEQKPVEEKTNEGNVEPQTHKEEKFEEANNVPRIEREPSGKHVKPEAKEEKKEEKKEEPHTEEKEEEFEQELFKEEEDEFYDEL